ncbi:hypothetical protein ACIRNU_34555 [Streptomyces rochei]|uniref:hypothetical protein n=1 Tax=Streptomyces rochei TaxID=1928 RepID=UPI0038162D5C
MSEWNLSVRLTGQGSGLARTLRDLSGDARTASRNVNALKQDIQQLRREASNQIRVRLNIDSRDLRQDVSAALNTAGAGQGLSVRLDVDGRHLRTQAQAAVRAASRGLNLTVDLSVNTRGVSRLSTTSRTTAHSLNTLQRAAREAKNELEELETRALTTATAIRRIGTAAGRAQSRLDTMSGSTRQFRTDLDDLDGSLTTVIGRIGDLRGRVGGLGGGGGGGGGSVAGRLGLQTLITLAPAAIPLAAGLVASVAPLAGAFSAAGLGAAAFGVALAGQIGPLSDAADAEKKYREAVREHGAASVEAAEAQLAYQRQLASMAPETQKAAVALSTLKSEFGDWSDDMAQFTMEPVTKGFVILQELLPHLSPEVQSFSGEMNRLMDVVGGSMQTPAFDALSDKVAALTDSSLDSFTDQVIHLLRVVSEGRATDGALGQIIDYARENGPEARAAIDAVGDAVGNLLEAGSEAGPTMLTLVTAVANLVAALPPELVGVLLQVAAGLKLIQLAGLGAAAASGAVGRLSTAIGVLGATSAAAGGGIAGLRAAVASLSTGAKFGLAAAGVTALVLALHEMSDNKPAVQVDELSTSLNTLISTGKTTGVLNSNLDEMADSIAMVSKGASDNKLAQWTSDFGTWVGIATGPGISTAKKNVDAWDQSMANLVKSGNLEAAADQYALLEKLWKAADGDMGELKEATTGYSDALADHKFEQEQIAKSMGVFGQAAQDTTAKLSAQKSAADGLRASIIALNETNRSAHDAEVAFERSLDNLTAAFKENGATLDVNTKAGQDNREAMSQAATAQDELIVSGLAAGETFESMVGKTDRLRTSMLALATQAFDGNKQKAQEYVNTLLGTPSEVKTLIKAETEAAISDLEAVKSEIASTNGKTIIMQAPTAAARAQLEALGFKIEDVPGSKNVKITIPTGTPISAVNAIQGAINGMHGKNIGIGIYKTEYLNTVRVGTAIDGKKYPGVTPQARGSVLDFYANGGVRDSRDRPNQHVAEIAPAGSYRIFGERETGGESYIPLSPSKRPRSRRIAEETVRRLGGDPATIQWYADGGLSGWQYDPGTGSLYSPSDAGRAGHKTKKVKGKEVEYFDLAAVERKLWDLGKATAAWNRNLEKVAERAGTDVAQALASMGEDGLKIAAKMATGSNKYVASMSIALRGLEQTARASLKAFTTDLNHAFGNQSIFQQNLAKLAAQGFGDLAARLANQNDQAAYDLAAAAVSDKGKASKANTASKNAEKALTQEQLSALVAIIAAITSKTTGIHDVAGKTGLGEDEIIEVANKAKAQITKSLGSRATRFLADLGKANKGLAYANGGLRAGIYATQAGIIRFAEPETHGEAYLPLSPSKRRTALPVLADVANRFGVGLTDAAAGRPVVIVKHGDSMQVTVTPVRTGASATDIAAQVGRSWRRARRGGVAARAGA